MKRLLPRTLPFWALAACWNTYPFRIVWAGWWQITYDRSHAWYKRWPHLSIAWNDD